MLACCGKISLKVVIFSFHIQLLGKTENSSPMLASCGISVLRPFVEACGIEAYNIRLHNTMPGRGTANNGF